MWTTPAWVCAAQLARGACRVLAALASLAQVTTWLWTQRVKEDDSRSIYIFIYTCISHPSLLRIALVCCVQTVKSIFRAPFWLRERGREKLDSVLWSERPYYRFMSLFQPMQLRKADYLHLQGSVDVSDVSQHIFITSAQRHTGQLIGKSWMFFLKLLDW